MNEKAIGYGYYRGGTVPVLVQFLLRTVAAQIHLLAAILAGLAWPYLMQLTNEAPHQLVLQIYGLGIIGLFSVSSLYHFAHDGLGLNDRLTYWLEALDQSMIYYFIAACYTVLFYNIAPTDSWRFGLLTFCWSVAALGILYTMGHGILPSFLRHRFVYTATFIAMGWTCLIRFDLMLSELTTEQFWLFLGGGIAYSIGAVLYAIRWPNLIRYVLGFHELWHLLVVIGALCHFGLVTSFY